MPAAALCLLLCCVCALASADCLLCRQCGYDVADSKHLYDYFSPLSLLQGNQTLSDLDNVQFQVLENPLGIRFKVVTVLHATCSGPDQWHTEFSWFPGYAWKHCFCNRCGHHLGWIFEPLATALPEQLGPTSNGFYAIILDNVLSALFSDSLLIIPRAYKS